ncbi:hypothetical protein COV24_01290 [candidate division WWE3 bacterium CG10_big_fil_rev_8_21_14_0_10_32_10]|uniref:Uncharacterized protein n=1 Tax=candidate division WWE3 bacterium CG10_big_fil_rev_8_21_14_0_10_32_10 TaxID=1975090 RepID=A0A2H0RAW3_UNCKA|nr:MAG: hypothetical protein COV24_01290 [candidate division WWE3 bacterium CG10_big_fil_rev_8_21_14_0_10_32_10]
MTQKRNNQESGLIVGFLLGFVAYMAYDVWRDEDKKQKVKKDIKKVSKELSPYIEELKLKVESNESLQDTVKNIDKRFGTDLYSYITSDLKKSEEKKIIKPDTKASDAVKRVKKFFNIK